MKKYWALLLTSCMAASAAPITLSDAIEMAKSSNSQIKAEKAKVEMAESGQSEARSRFMPQLTLTASVTKINDPITIDLSSLQGPLSDIAGAAAYSKAYVSTYNAAYEKKYGELYDGAVKQMVAAGMTEDAAKTQAKAAVDAKMGDIWSGVVSSKDANDAAVQQAEKYGAAASEKIKDSKDFSMKVQDDVFFNARLTAIWPLFTGFKRTAAYSAAKDNVTAKKAAFEMAQNTVLMDVATKYFTLRLAEELTVMREETKKNLEEHLARSKKLEEGGQISKAERLRAEVALAEAENALEDSYRDQSLARMALASLLHTDTSLTAVTPVLTPENMHSMEEFKQMALEKHPGLAQLRTERKRSQAAVSAAQGDYYPMVALFAYKELYTKDLTILEPEWAVGAKLQWDLFKGGETRSKVANAKALDRSLGSMEEQTVDNIKLLVEKRWREKEHAKSRLVSLSKTRELAEEAHRSQTLAYEAGLATGLDVVDAELALSRLQVAELKAHFDAVVAWLGLLEASGEVANAGEMLKDVKPVEPAPAEEAAKVVEPAKPAEAQAVQPPMAMPAADAANEPVPPAAPAEAAQPVVEAPAQAQ
ncbi:TolC family protein [Fibrobacter sp. UWEL]|uniref:TolC family protein n=1 Tax=Fibrobacter sp. UWEL TaxID=1896209 RepID=UPI00091167E4|nr:TolC family protein [Fibrobacter sp. UWEL]SHK90503.1 Outer membrane protein TolC [Fibrobacter sp. UWEL]